jgi:hypothetical protein
MVGRKDLKIVDTSQLVFRHYIRAEVSEMNHTALVLLVLAIASEVAGTAGLKGFEGLGGSVLRGWQCSGTLWLSTSWPRALSTSRWESPSLHGRDLAR